MYKLSLFRPESEALAAAQADLRRRNRKGKQIRLTLAVGKPELIAETPIILSGFKADIDGSSWIASEVAHNLNSGG